MLLGEDLPIGVDVRGCRDADGNVVIAFDGSQGRVPNVQRQLWAAFPDGPTRFLPAVTARTSMPDPAGMMGSRPWIGFGCDRDGSPRWVWLEGQVLHDVKCSRGGCIERRSGELGIAVEDFSMRFAPVGSDDVLLVYRRLHEVAGTAWHVRRAPVSRISMPSTDRTLLCGDFPGLASVGPVFAFGRGDIGWVVISEGHSFYAFRSAADGTFSPVHERAN